MQTKTVNYNVGGAEIIGHIRLGRRRTRGNSPTKSSSTNGGDSTTSPRPGQ